MMILKIKLKKEDRKEDSGQIKLNLDLLRYSKKGDKEKILELISHPKLNINYKNEEGWSALHFACDEGNLKVADILIKANININSQDNNGHTAFHFACIGTVAAVLTLLLNHKPNVFLEDKAGKRACVYLKTPEMKEIYNEYINRGNNIIK